MKSDPRPRDIPRPALLACGCADRGGKTAVRGDLAVLFPDWDGSPPTTTRTLYATFPAFRVAFDALRDALDCCLPVPLVAAVFAPPHGVDARLLEDPRYGKPALFGYQVSLFRLWHALGVDATAVTGHGIGELAAAHVAGTLGLRDAAHLTLTQEGGPCSAHASHPAGFGRLLRCEPVRETPAAALDPRTLPTAFRRLQVRGPEIDWKRLLASGTASGPLEESGLSPLSV
ncbi:MULTISPECIES: acyltransferase domain-containing protein [Streptomyces]|uniref:acyltransferase domain-containing protein n=1 Tax=Streptomyces TaxID=1883 RepID=UPI0006E2FD55|nr:acyltransferase domain-containing protein [Streptomyces prasinus]